MALNLAACGDDQAINMQSGQPAKETSTRAPTSKPKSESTPAFSPGMAAGSWDPNPTEPSSPVRLIFIHHSVGEDWLDDSKGRLGNKLMENNYFVSDTNYGWGPGDIDIGSEYIGDHTDIGHLYNWFAGPNSGTYLEALYQESAEHTGMPYSRISEIPAGENEIIVLKSCFDNSALAGAPGEPPANDPNPLRGLASGELAHTVGNAKGIYNDLLRYFATRQDKLFVVVTAPPLAENETNAPQAANARALNTWLVQEWLKNYPYRNVAVFDFFNVLTSNGGSPYMNDLDMMLKTRTGNGTGNQHRFWNGYIIYDNNLGGNYSAYASSGDSHPNAAGLQKASTSFVGFLNSAYNYWQDKSRVNN